MSGLLPYDKPLGEPIWLTDAYLRYRERTLPASQPEAKEERETFDTFRMALENHEVIPLVPRAGTGFYWHLASGWEGFTISLFLFPEAIDKEEHPHWKKAAGERPFVEKAAFEAWLDTAGERPFVEKAAFEACSNTHVPEVDLTPIRSRRGRPPKYLWITFYEEVKRILDHTGDFDNGVDPSWIQARLEEEMTRWCEINWGTAPSEPSVRKHVAIAASEFRLDRAQQGQ